MRALKPQPSTDPAALYDEDFFLWTQRIAELLRARNFHELDIEHAALEMEDMGKRDLKEVNSRTRVLVAHLLKWLFQPAKRSRSWKATIVIQRAEIKAELAQSPSLLGKLRRDLPDDYTDAVDRAAAETGLPRDRFPTECPFTLEQILDKDFLPE